MCLLSWCSVLLSKMSALPGSFLITAQALAALILVLEVLMVKTSSAAQTRHCYSLDSTWRMTMQLELLSMLSTPRLLNTLQLIKITLSCLKMFLFSMTLCVDHWIERVHCAVDVSLNMVLPSIHTHCSVRSAGIMVMDGPYTLPLNCSR